MTDRHTKKWFRDQHGVDWELNEKGDIRFSPVTGWATTLLKSGMAGGLRIKFATDISETAFSAHQFIMTAKQIRELGEMLTRMADDLDAKLMLDRPIGPLS